MGDEATPEMGLLSVRVVEAHNLATAEFSGSSDPFVVVTFDHIQVRTETLWKNLNPRWDVEFMFRVKQMAPEIKIEVYDDSRQSHPKFLGQVIVPFEPLLDQKPLAQLYPLAGRPNKKDNVSGNVRLALHYTIEKDVHHLASYYQKRLDELEESTRRNGAQVTQDMTQEVNELQRDLHEKNIQLALAEKDKQKALEELTLKWEKMVDTLRAQHQYERNTNVDRDTANVLELELAQKKLEEQFFGSTGYVASLQRVNMILLSLLLLVSFSFMLGSMAFIAEW